MINHQADASHYLRSVNPVVRAEVKFGAPSKDCRNVGICRIRLKDDQMKNDRCGFKKAKAIFFRKDMTSLVAYFVRNSIEETTIAKQFKGGVFPLEEPYMVPVEMIRELRLMEGAYIAPGKYKTSLIGSHYVVVFPLQIAQERPMIN